MLCLVIPKKPSELLHEAIAALKEGSVSEVARACGQSRAYFGRIRMKPVDVGIDTFAKICAGLGRSADDLMGLKPPDPLAPEVARLRAEVAALQATTAGLRKVIAQMAQLPAAPQAVAEPPKRSPASRKG